MKCMNTYLTITLLSFLTFSSVSANAEITKEDCLHGDLFQKFAANGTVDMVMNCLNVGVPIDTFEGNGWTALHAAAFNGRLEVTELLVSAGAEINVEDNNAKTPLDLAKQRKHLAIVETLSAVNQSDTAEDEVSVSSEKAVKLAEALRFELNNFGPASSNDEIDYQVVEILSLDKNGTGPDAVYTIIVKFKTGVTNDGNDLISYKGVVAEDANGHLSVTDKESL